ncbi:MAG: ABC transporter ATP-binding protein [Firmicutes bacterium]|nr:ABC transporter ATP-binding protein [Bacillota bacterium]
MLRVQDLNVFYGGIHALRGVSLNVEEGEIVAIIGANGAGKSTLMRAVSGLIRARSGSIKFRDVDLLAKRPYDIVGLGICQVPEGRRIFANLSVLDNLEMGAFLRRDAAGTKQTLEKVFQLFPRLQERSKQRAGTLSGGEQQMLAIGRALMSNPRLLLMDEPSLGLAPILVKAIFGAIRDINRLGTTVLLVEQNARGALALSSRAYVMETGCIVREGPARALSTDPEIQKAYLGAASSA